MRVGIVVSEFNYDITMMMLERAKAQAEFLEMDVAVEVSVPGVFEIPLAVRRMLRERDLDGVVTLGAVIEGETKHDENIIQHAMRKIMDLSLEYGVPVGLGISGPGMTRLQAEERIENARNAVESVAKMHERMRDI